MKWIEFAKLKHLYRLANSPSPSYLVDRGWFESAVARRPIDAAGRPLPWLSYPFIDFVRPRLHKEMSLVEFGAGYSTLFWASHVDRVFSIETDSAWYGELRGKVPANVTLIHHDYDQKKPEDYARSADHALGLADIVLVDGPERDVTLRHAPELLRPAGVIVLDNARRSSYAEASDCLVRDFGFRKLEFVGMGPSAVRECVTALFYRDANCLNV